MLPHCSVPWDLDIVQLLISYQADKDIQEFCKQLTRCWHVSLRFACCRVDDNPDLDRHNSSLTEADSLRLVEFAADFGGLEAGATLLHVARPFSKYGLACLRVFLVNMRWPDWVVGGEPVGYCTSAPIHAVAESGNVTLAKQLLSAGVDPEEPHSKIGTWPSVQRAQLEVQVLSLAAVFFFYIVRFVEHRYRFGMVWLWRLS